MAKKGATTESEQRKLANLKPFKKGESGNPKGRPVGSRNVSTVLKEILGQIAPDVIKNTKFVKEFCKINKSVTNADAVAARILYEALVAGESWAIKELMERTEGKATQGVELSGPDGGAMEVMLVIPKANDADTDS